ncbi:MAG: amino acid permease [Planctomycetes bacterium]|nr:amino acid permease [Planctomycetota bacterium]
MLRVSDTSPPDASLPSQPSAGHGFGTAPVFLAAISTILGAIMFLRFGYAVGHLGLIGALAVILLGHAVTVPTALAVSEIATNRRVEGGGEYYVVSRSFGLRIGSAIGIALYLSQAISVAFYSIAFAEAFRPLAEPIADLVGMPFDPRMISIPSIVVLLLLMLSKGAELGVRLLYPVVGILGLALACFFAGSPTGGANGTPPLDEHVAHPDNFFLVFAICFPAFTGMTAGVGLSGDLKRPGRSIPLGTLGATVAGGLIYMAIVWKLASAAPPALLAEDQLVMSRIALWAPIIPIGLGCATFSSALGSILVAPRTLQALGKDDCLPAGGLNRWISKGSKKNNEPRNATVLTIGIALVTAMLGDVDAVARLVSMFFMVTYGALCAVSFLEHFAASPSYRPSFRSRWYISLFGGLICLLMMFQMDPVFAVLSLGTMAGLYWITGFAQAATGGQDLQSILRGAMQQATRRMNVQLQRWQSRHTGRDWRPSIVLLEPRVTTGSRDGLRLLEWLCQRHGFGTYLRLVRGELDEQMAQLSKEMRAELVEICSREFPAIFAGTIISPSMASALTMTLQMPGVSGVENNTVLFDFSESEPVEVVEAVVRSALFAAASKKNLLFLRHGERRFGKRESIHVWLTWHDTQNATLMMLLVYILVGHADWEDAEISVFAAFPDTDVDAQQRQFVERIEAGRIPVSRKNVRFHTVKSGEDFRALVSVHSAKADLIVMGLTFERLREKGVDLLTRHREAGEVLFVLASESVLID